MGVIDVKQGCHTGLTGLQQGCYRGETGVSGMTRVMGAMGVKGANWVTGLTGLRGLTKVGESVGKEVCADGRMNRSTSGSTRGPHRPKEIPCRSDINRPHLKYK